MIMKTIFYAKSKEALINVSLAKIFKSSIIEESKARQVCGMKDQITLTDVEYGNRKKRRSGRNFSTRWKRSSRGKHG